MDLLGIIPIESICIGLNLVLEHRLGHNVKHADFGLRTLEGEYLSPMMDLRCPIMKICSSMGQLHMMVKPSPNSVSQDMCVFRLPVPGVLVV